MKLSSFFLLTAVITGTVATAQNAVSPPPMPRSVTPAQPAVAGGTVTGHVYAADTQRPARFADVELVQEMESRGRGFGRGNGPNYNTQARARTALDGSFTIQNVPPGDYYVVASMTGYISPLQVARMNQTELRAPQTHVAANGAADTVVTMERGAVVTGRVAYDDGSPVAGVPVRVSLVNATGGNSLNMGVFAGGFGGSIFFGGGMTQTDDRGVYRIMGVPPGRYILSATVQTESMGEGRAAGSRQMVTFSPPPMLTIYAPATMHKAQGQAFDVRGGETIDGIDIRVALDGLHTVKGTVEAKADSHPLNSGMVSLADSTDNSTVRMARVNEDGTFRMDYVPAGTYTLNVSGQDRTLDPNNPGRSGSSFKRYTSSQVSVTVGDHDAALDPVLLDEAKSSETAQAGNR